MMKPKKQRILEYINESEIEVFPRQIAKETGINHSTVRVYCRELIDQGKILQPYPGTYASKITYGMMLAPLRVHNVILSVVAPWLDFSEDFVEWTGSVKLRVQFGLQRRRITGRISCGKGMDHDTLLFVLNRFYDVFEEKTGRKVEDVIVKTFELNRDVPGVRIDGAKCFTRKGLSGFIERIYQKGDVVRAEVKVSKEMSISEFEALLHGGMPSLDIVQAQFVMSREVKALGEAVKHNTALMRDVLGVMRALLERKDS